MKSFKDFITERKGFKKTRNSGVVTRGKVVIDITAPNEELADRMEELLVDEGFDSAEYGDDLGSGGYLFSMVINSNEMKDFNFYYNKFKKELS
jgi:hypothetical protein